MKFAEILNNELDTSRLTVLVNDAKTGTGYNIMTPQKKSIIDIRGVFQESINNYFLQIIMTENRSLYACATPIWLERFYNTPMQSSVFPIDSVSNVNMESNEQLLNSLLTLIGT